MSLEKKERKKERKSEKKKERKKDYRLFRGASFSIELPITSPQPHI